MMLNCHRVLGLLVFFSALLTFARLAGCDFSWLDDDRTLHHNPRMNPPTMENVGYYWTHAGYHETMGLYVPVTYTFWEALAAMARRDKPDAEGIVLSPAVYHAANLLLHAITSVLVFQLLWKLVGDNAAAALGALLFALHPVQVETVGWVSGGKDLLCGFFSIASLLVFLPFLQRPNTSGAPASRWIIRYAAATTLFLLAMLSKPTGVVVPLVAAALALFVFNVPWKAAFWQLLPWVALMVPCLIWTQRVQPASQLSSLPLWGRPAVAADALAFYLMKLAWPARLCVDYGHNPPAILANHQIFYTWLIPAGIALLLWWRRRSSRTAIAAGLLFVIPILPVSGLVPFDYQLASTTTDHYLYLPMLGVALLSTWVVKTCASGRIYCLAGAILMVLGIRSILQEAVWQDTRTLYRHTLDVNPRSGVALQGMGFMASHDARLYQAAGDPQRALERFNESIDWYQRAIAADRLSVASMYNLATKYQAIGREDLGREQLHRIIAVQKELPEGLKADPLILAHLLANFHDQAGAIAWLDEVIARDPENQPARALRDSAIRPSEGAGTRP